MTKEHLSCPVCDGRLVFHIGDNKVLGVDCFSDPPCQLSRSQRKRLITKHQAELDSHTYPLWVKCPDGCDEYFCTIHRKHVSDCACPEIDYFKFDPYTSGGFPLRFDVEIDS